MYVRSKDDFPFEVRTAQASSTVARSKWAVMILFQTSGHSQHLLGKVRTQLHMYLGGRNTSYVLEYCRGVLEAMPTGNTFAEYILWYRHISPLSLDSHQSSLSIQFTIGQGHLISNTNFPPFSRVLSRNLLIWSANCGPNSSQRTSGYHVTIDREPREVGEQQALHVAGAHPKRGSSNCREDACSVCRPNIAASEASWHLN